MESMQKRGKQQSHQMKLVSKDCVILSYDFRFVD